VVMLVPGAPPAPPPGAPQGFLSAPQAAIGAPVVRRRAPPRPIQDIGPEEAYAFAVEQDDLPTYVEYVRVYPNSPYSQRIWATIRARREALLWRHALLDNSPDSYWTYVERYPDGMYVFDAHRRLRRLAAGDRPPPGWRMRDYDDVPMPLAGEPARMYDVYPPAPPPRRWLAPPPAFIVGLPAPERRDRGGLWRNQQQSFPVIIQPPPGGQRPGAGGPGELLRVPRYEFLADARGCGHRAGRARFCARRDAEKSGAVWTLSQTGADHRSPGHNDRRDAHNPGIPQSGYAARRDHGEPEPDYRAESGNVFERSAGCDIQVQDGRAGTCGGDGSGRSKRNLGAQEI